MNEIIKINNENKVDGRSLHEFLQIETPFKKWIDRMLEYGFVEGVDFWTEDKNVRRADGTIMPQKQTEYDLTIGMAKEICMIQRNERGKQARLYFIECEKRLKAQCKSMSQVEILAQAAQQLVEQEKRLTAVEKRMDGVRDIVALSANGWRQDSAHLINRIAERLGGAEHISEVRKESYKLLNERMHADVAARLRNLKRKAAEEGMCKSKRDKLNYLDVIGQDPRLIEGYTIVVKDMAIRYGVADEDVN